VSRAIDLRVVELLAAHLCHDLIGPLAAVGNGAELLADEDADFARDAIALVGESARKANRRLQFYRFAYGYSGGSVAGPPPRWLAAELFADGSISCDYPAEVQALPTGQQKLACNLLAVAAEALPRGGRLVLGASAIGPELVAVGEGSRLSPETRAALSLAMPAAELTSRLVGAYFAGLVAADLACRIVTNDNPAGFRFELVAGAGGSSP
jgi:histidine phosphotransferase ChpT